MLFWIVLAVLTASCLLAVMWPLLGAGAAVAGRDAYDAEVYRDQLGQIENEHRSGLLDEADADAARIEVSRRLIAASGAAKDAVSTSENKLQTGRRMTAAGLLVGVPLLSLCFYLFVGSPGLPGLPYQERQDALRSQALENRDLTALVVQAEAHVQENPGDLRGWSVLAPAYLQLGRLADAASAYAQTIALGGGDAATLTDYGEVLVLLEQGLITEQALGVFEEAVTLDPSEHRARFYIALAARQDGRILEAIEAWELILQEASSDATYRPFIQSQIDDARNALGLAPALSEEQLQDVEGMSPEEQLALIEGMIDNLASRLQEDGSDLSGWARLLNAYVVLGRAEEALQALAQARDNFSGDAEALAQLDDVSQRLGLEEIQN